MIWNIWLRQAGKNKQNVGERRGFIKKVSGRGKGSAIIDITLTDDETWSLLPSFDVKVMDPYDELFAKHQAVEKRKSELKLKMKDIDPYGEEDWLEEEIVDIMKLNNISDKLNITINKVTKYEEGLEYLMNI